MSDEQEFLKALRASQQQPKTVGDEQEFLNALNKSKPVVNDEQEFLNALSKSKPVATAPVAPSVPVQTQVQEKPSALASAEKDLTESEVFGIPVGSYVQKARHWLIGEPVAALPTEILGPVKPTGAQASQDMQMASRESDLPEYRKLRGFGARSAIQAAANVSAGAVGVLGSVVSLPLEAAVYAGRYLGGASSTMASLGATSLYDMGYTDLAEAMFGKETAAHLSLSERHFAEEYDKNLKDAGERLQRNPQSQEAIEAYDKALNAPRSRLYAEWRNDIEAVAEETVKGLAFGLNPAIYTFIKGKANKDPLAFDKAMEAFAAYPLETILPIAHATKGALRVGGKEIPVRPVEPAQQAQPSAQAAPAPAPARAPASEAVVPVDVEVVRTIKGEPVKLNELGRVVFEPFTTAEKYNDAMRAKLGDSAVDVLRYGKERVEPAWQKFAFDVVTQREMQKQRAVAAARAPQYANRSEAADKLKLAVHDYNLLRDIETELADPKYDGATALQKFQAIEGTLGETTSMRDVPVLDRDSRQIATNLGELFVANGMNVETAQHAIPFLIFESLRNEKATATQIEGFRGVKEQVQQADPFVVLSEIQDKIAKSNPQEAAALVRAIDTFITSRRNDPAFFAAADAFWSNKKQVAIGTNVYRWTPGREVMAREGYVRALESIREKDAQMGRTVFDISIPEFGELRKDYTFQLYNNLIDDLRSSPQGQERVLNMLRSQPLSRMAANPTAPAHIHALAAFSNKPGGLRRQLVDLLNQAAIEAAENYGYDPAVIAKRYDMYLSRAFTDAIDASSKLADFISKMESESPALGKAATVIQSSRFKRRLSQESSNERFTDMVNRGDISLHDALAMTVVSAMNVNKHLANMAAITDQLVALGVTSDTPRPGYTKPYSKRVTDRKQAASDDPYNFVYGKLATKYIRSDVANQLGMVRDAVQKFNDSQPWARVFTDLGGEVLKFNRFTHTMLNSYGYLRTNATNDPLITMAATGHTPYSGKGKKVLLEVQAASDRFDRTVDSPEGAVLSPEMKEMIEQGFDLRTTSVLNDLPQSMRGVVQRTGDYIHNATVEATNPMDRIGAAGRAAMYTRAYAKTISGGTMAIWKAFNDTRKTRNFEKVVLENQHEIEMLEARILQERRKVEIAKNQKDPVAQQAANAEVARLTSEVAQANDRIKQTIEQAKASDLRVNDPEYPTIWPSQYMANLNKHLHQTAITYAAAKMERERAIWSYTLARRELGLPPDRAAIFTREAIYGHETANPTVRAIANNPLALITTPMFFNFGVWQLSKNSRRVLNDPNLWMSYVLQQGLRAGNEHAVLQEDFGDSAYKGRLAKMHLQRSAVAEMPLGTLDNVQRSLVEMGWPKTWVDRLGDKKSSLNMSLVDPTGGRTFFHQINPDRSGGDYFFQFGVYGPVLSQQIDRLNKNFNDLGSMPMPGDPGISPWAKATLRSLTLATFPSTLQVKNIGFTREVPIVMPFGRALSGTAEQVRAIMNDKPVYKNVYGAELSPLEVAGKEVGWFMPNAVDSMAYMEALQRRMRHEANVIKNDERIYKSSLPANIADEIRSSLVSEAHINATIKAAQMRLNYGWPYGFISRDEAMTESARLEKMRVDAIKALKEQKPNGEILIHMFDNERMNGFHDHMNKVMVDALEDIEGEDGEKRSD